MRSLAVFTVAVLSVLKASAQQKTFTIDPSNSEIKMTLNTTHEVVHGVFHVQSGTVGWNGVTHTMSGSMIVAAGSGQTGNGSRDKRMNKQILLVERYASVSFEPKTYTGVIADSGDSTIQVSGIITLIAMPHEVTIPMLVHLDSTTATSNAHFLIPYIQWGLKDPSLFIWKAEKEVAIDVAIQGSLSH